jgi:hypothetical protein
LTSFSTYSSLQDFNRLARFIALSWKTSGPDSQLHIGNLAWRLNHVDLRKPCNRIGLWSSANNELVAFAIVHKLYPLDMQIRLDIRDEKALFNEMLAWIESTWPPLNADSEDPRPLRISCLEKNVLLAQILSDRGYNREDRGYHRMIRSLTGSPLDERLPRGYDIRSVRLPDDVDQAVQLHRVTFPNSQLTACEYKRVVTSSCYSPELNCFVVNDDGVPIAFVIGWEDLQSRSVEFEPVGCHPDWRRRGLTLSLLYRLMQRGRERGVGVASLTARADKPDVIAFYRTAGFFIHMNEWVFAKPID